MLGIPRSIQNNPEYVAVGGLFFGRSVIFLVTNIIFPKSWIVLGALLIGAAVLYTLAAGSVRGFFYGDGKQFTAQLIAAFTCFAWNFTVAGLCFKMVGALVGGNRVPPEVEIAGLDIPEMGASGYPEFITPLAPEMISRSQYDE